MTSSATTQNHILGLGLAHPNICNLLEGVRGLVLHNDNRRTYMTWKNNRISKRSLDEGPVIMVYQKPERP